MSKSYGNVIPIFIESGGLSKLIKKVKTNSLEPGQPKDPEGCTLFGILKAFGSSGEVDDMRLRYEEGVGWGQVKTDLIELIDQRLKPFREEYLKISEDRDYVETTLRRGAEKAIEVADPVLERVREAVGIKSF